MIRPLRAAAIGAALLVLLAGCASSPAANGPDRDPSASSTPSDAGPELTGDLTVFAAASLSGAFDKLSEEFEKQHPSVDVKPVSYDGSSVLATQINEGASVDVFASADERNMAKVTEAGNAADPTVFATNTLQIAVAPGNPKKITGLESLSAAGLTVVLCAPEVPCGNASQTLLKDAGVVLKPASEEQNVTAVLSKVKNGEADAGLVYRTDVTAAGDAVTGVDIANTSKAVNRYPVVALKDAPNKAVAEAFVAFVLSPEGRTVLDSFGFGAP
ncbi:molybdate ABC transporter substrate-binding protein [Microbacterium sp.]|uniref:molybdate ABC transporter substrate-binding protein n=1 Tax=Microbacterium sp. TaxID=51671 RepID=UPI00333E2959